MTATGTARTSRHRGGSTYGVAKGVSLVAVRVLDCAGDGTNSGVIGGIDWAPATTSRCSGGRQHEPRLRRLLVRWTRPCAPRSPTASRTAWRPATRHERLQLLAGPYGRGAHGRVDDVERRALVVLELRHCLDTVRPGLEHHVGVDTSTPRQSTISGTSMATPHVEGDPPRPCCRARRRRSRPPSTRRSSTAPRPQGHEPGDGSPTGCSTRRPAPRRTSAATAAAAPGCGLPSPTRAAWRARKPKGRCPPRRATRSRQAARTAAA